VLYVTDNQSGVDTSSIELKVDSVVIPHGKLNIINDGVGDTVKYIPLPADSFAYSSEINIEFEVKDLASTPNQADTSYSFFIVVKGYNDVEPPEIEIVYPKPTARNIPTTAAIILYVTDDLSGVDTSSVNLMIDKQLIPHDVIQFINDGVGDTVKYIPLIAFAKRSRISVDFAVSDFVGNTADTSYWFISGGARMVVRSNPFTPNGDGFNDETEFNFKDIRVVNPVLKIFDIHGRLMKEIIGQPGDCKFRWNGRDQNGKLLLPGIYLYVLLDGNKAKERGCIAIAR